MKDWSSLNWWAYRDAESATSSSTYTKCSTIYRLTTLNIKFIYSDRRGIQAVIPPLHKQAPSRAQQKYDSSFSVLGPKLWNLLPKSTTLQTTLASFKSSLQKFLDDTPDKPPVRGYTTANHNSLLHWRGQNIDGGLRTAARRPRWSWSSSLLSDSHFFTSA